MIHYVYKITNKINGKFYIGKKSSKNIDDNYYGSGVVIRQAIKKYGIDNFQKEILKTFNTSEEAFLYESTLVTTDLINDKNCYNQVTGGELTGGVVFSEEAKRKRSSHHIGVKRSSQTRELQSKKKKEFIEKFGTESFGKGSFYVYNESTKEMKRVIDGIIPEGFVKGGCPKKMVKTMFISNLETLEVRKIPKDDIIPEGWIKGNLNNKNKISIYNIETKQVKKIKKTDVIPEGWELGGGGVYSNNKERKW